MNRPRIAFYCHNTYGLGHVMRSLTIAEAVVAQGAECMVITGCRHIASLRVPAGVEIHALTPAAMDAIHRPIPLPDDVDKGNIITRRSSQIQQFCRRWQPDCLVVDHHPLGLGGELVETILDPELAHVRMIWGVPYPEDIPTKLYRNPRLSQAVRRYGQLLAYCDRKFDDILESAGAEMLPAEVNYVGVVTSHEIADRHESPGKWIVALCGGGYGSESLHDLVITAAAHFPDYPLRIVTGPQIEEERVGNLAVGRQCQIVRTAPVEKAIEDAAVVISRTGYNSAFSLIQTDLPVIFVPRKLLNDDQPRRAEMLTQLENVWSVHEDKIDAAASLERALAAALAAKPQPGSRKGKIDLNGAVQAAECILAGAKKQLRSIGCATVFASV